MALASPPTLPPACVVSSAKTSGSCVDSRPVVAVTQLWRLDSARTPRTHRSMMGDQSRRLLPGLARRHPADGGLRRTAHDVDRVPWRGAAQEGFALLEVAVPVLADRCPARRGGRCVMTKDQVAIGMDPHKRSMTIEARDARELLRATGRSAPTTASTRRCWRCPGNGHGPGRRASSVPSNRGRWGRTTRSWVGGA